MQFDAPSTFYVTCPDKSATLLSTGSQHLGVFEEAVTCPIGTKSSVSGPNTVVLSVCLQFPGEDIDGLAASISQFTVSAFTFSPGATCYGPETIIIQSPNYSNRRSLHPKTSHPTILQSLCTGASSCQLLSSRSCQQP